MNPVPPPTLGLAPGSDTGISHTDGITADTTPIVIGTAVAGAPVTLLDDDGTVLGTTRADSKGNYLLASAALADGTHALTVTQTVAGTTISSAPLDLDVETEATATITAASVPETATGLTFSVHFDQPVSAISPTSFVLATTGTAYGNVTAVSGSGETYTVTVNGLGGEGMVGLAFSAYTPTDLADNQVVLTKSVGHDVSDTTTPTTVLVSSDQFGVAGTGGTPAISGGGRLVAFISDDPNLVPSITTQTGIGNIYVKDIQTGAIALVDNGNDQSYDVQISYDGTVVAFSSVATNLVPGGTPSGQLNLYTAQLMSAASAGGLSFVPGSLRLVATLDPDVAQGLTQDAFALSGDGSTLAFGTEAALPGGAGSGDNSYAYNLATGAYTLIPGAVSGEITSISSTGTEVAYNKFVAVPGTGGQPNPNFGGTLPPASVEDAFVFNAAAKTTTSIDGSGLLPDTSPPTLGGDVASYATFDPVLTGNGNTVVFQLTRGGELSSLFSVNLSGPTHTTPISPGAATDGAGDYDSDQAASYGGGVIAYDNNSPTNGITSEVYSAADGGGTSTLGPALETVLSAQGNAVALADYTDNTQTTPAVYETSLGVSASIAPIDGNDTIDKTDLALATANGMTISGTSNAPAGSPVQLYLTRATASGSLDPFTTAVGEDGEWSATLPEEEAAVLTDGPYFLTVQVSDASGASPQVSRLVTVDTVAPTAPTTPVLDQGSNSGKDGVDTNVATPTLDGLTEPGAFVTLYDTSGGGQTKLGTATADENGVYTVTSTHLPDGTHTLAVQAQDAAGNSSVLSDKATVIVDTIAPQQPSAPVLEQAQDTGRDDNNTINDPTPEIGGVAEPKASITLYDGGVALRTVRADADGSYLVTTPTLANGSHSLAVIATDAAGNASPASDPLAVVVDTVVPTAPLLANVTGTTESDGGLSPSFDVTGVSLANTVVTLEVDGVTVPSDAAATRASGFYDIAVPFLDAGSHTLSVTATDQAGNVSAASAPTTVTITSTAIAPVGTPPGAAIVNGVLEDGTIAGATVFADTNGNGVLDAGEASAVTTTAGQFTLFAPSGELVATGGVDSATGLTPPGLLTAPAGSTLITPLTTLLDAYLATQGGTLASAQAAVAAALGLDPATDLTQLDPETAAVGGDLSFLVASARVMDTAVIFTDVIVAQTGVSSATAFAASFAALAQAAGAGTLKLQDENIVQAVLAAASAIAAPAAVLSAATQEEAAVIASTGNVELGYAATPGNGNTSQGFVDAVERAEQGEAAPQYAAGVPNAVGIYKNALGEQVSAAEAPVLAAPMLAPGQDTGISPYDNVTSLSDPVFTGTAPPGATVLLAASLPSYVTSYSVVGSGIANAGGSYSITAQLDGEFNDVVAIQAAPGQATAVGSTVTVPTLPASEVTYVIVGSLAMAVGVPSIRDVSYVASSANDATHSAIYVDGVGALPSEPDGIYTLTADGDPTPIGSSVTDAGVFGIVTSPLANGPHSLVVTQTLADGETLQSLPFTVTVTAPGSITLDAQATGPITGGSIFGFEDSYELTGLGGVDQGSTTHPAGITDATGTVTVPTLFNVPNQERTTGVDLTHGTVELAGGEDSLTGLPLPSDLLAPPGAAVITPVTTLVATAIYDADIGGAPVTAAEIAFETGRVAHDLGLASTLDLLTADPLAMAEAGDPSLLLKGIELLDTVSLLAPFVPNPFNAIDKSAQIFTFGSVFTPPLVTNAPIDFTSAAEVLGWMTTNRSNSASADASVLPQAAAIIAASNAAIEAHAKTATSLADTLSYALAVERVALGTEAQALAVSASFAAGVVGEQQSDFTALQAAYTGSGLDAAVAATLAGTVQVTGFAPLAASTGAASEDFSLTFSAPVTGLTTADFSLSASAGLLRSAVTAVTPVAGSGGTAYTVAVSTGVGQGTLTLDFTPDGIAGSDGTPLTGGSFAPVQSYGSPSADGSDFVDGLAVGDFNGDGRPDVAESLASGIDSDGSITLFLGQGDGTFVAQPANYAGLLEPGDLVAGDFNGDGKLDLLTLGTGVTTELGRDPAGDYDVAVLLGNGNGTFGAPVQTEVGTLPPLALTTGDFNADGKLDLAVLTPSRYGSDANVQIYLGNGDGTFTAGTTVDAGNAAYGDYSRSIVEADLNGDGKADLVVSTDDSLSQVPSVSVLLGDGHGGFTLAAPPALTFSGSDTGSLVAVGDLNGDGIPDLVVLPSYPAAAADANGAIAATLDVLLGRGDGTFQPATSVAIPLPPLYPNEISKSVDSESRLAIGDVTGDGKPDIVIQNDTYGDIVLPSLGNGSFGTAYFTTVDQGVLNSGRGLALADVNSDGRLDLLTSSDGSAAGNSVGLGIGVALNTAQTVLPASTSVSVSRAAAAAPVLTELSGGGTLTENGNGYTLNLGILAQGSNPAALLFALANAAAAGSDAFDGTFQAPSGNGFTVTGTSLASPVLAGASQGGLSFAADTGTLGSHTETITFAPRDATDDFATTTVAPDSAEGQDPTGVLTPAADPAGADVSGELAPITLTVNDTIAPSGTLVPASILVAGKVALPNVRVGGTDSTALPVTNGAVSPAAALDVSAAATGMATVSGSVTGLAPGAADAADLVVGLNTATAGAQSGTITLTPVSDAAGVTTPLATVPVPVSGSVFRSAAAQIAPVNAIVHVGDPGTVALPVGNSDPADGFSESLIAAIASVTPGLTIAAGAPTADIAPGATNRTLAVGVSTAAAGTVSGTATLSLTSDGSGVDGLGTLALAAATVPVSVTVDNFAQATLAAAGATLSGSTAAGYILNFGAVQQGGAPVSATLDTVNSAAGPADALAGSYAVANAPGFTDSGFAVFSGDGTGQADAGGTVTLQTGQAGTFSQTIVLHSAGSNASGYSGALADQTVTVEGTVTPPGPPTGSITTNPASLTVAEDAPATAIGITAPTDPSYTAAQLVITAGRLPTDGTVLLADGVTAVTAGEVLTSAQLAGLLFTPAAGQFGQDSAFTYTVADPADHASTGTATLGIGPAIGTPVTTPGTLTVAPGQGATALGIQASADPNYAATALAATVTALPADGAVDLADGTTPITLGQVLSIAQLTSLTFLPAAGASSTQSSFAYSVADPAGNASAGSFTLAIGGGASGMSPTGTSATMGAPAPPVLSPGNLLSDVPNPAVSGTALAGSLVTLLSNGTAIGTATASAAGAFTAVPVAPLPLGPNVLTATATTSGGVSAASAPVELFETPAQVSGVSIPDASTRDVVDTLGQPFGLELTSGTQQVQLLDGTISVAPGTNEGYLARLYEGLFGRTPDAATGYADDQFAMGLTHVQIATEFLASPEGQADFSGLTDSALVSKLAQGLLGRSFSASDQSAFTNLLGSGTSRGAVLAGIADSAEAQAHLSTATSDVFIPRPTAAGVYEMFETGLGRDGDLAGVQFASNEVLQSGLTLLQVAQQIAITPEFLGDHASQSNAAYVGDLYQNGLGRIPDSAGAALTTALNAGQITRADALFSVATSPEASAYLTRYIT